MAITTIGRLAVHVIAAGWFFYPYFTVGASSISVSKHLPDVHKVIFLLESLTGAFMEFYRLFKSPGARNAEEFLAHVALVEQLVDSVHLAAVY